MQIMPLQRQSGSPTIPQVPIDEATFLAKASDISSLLWCPVSLTSSLAARSLETTVSKVCRVDFLFERYGITASWEAND
jgi:hypothetical protein